MSLAALTSPAGLAILTACAFVWSLIATHLAIKLAHRYALHAVPDHRSSHTIPTPRIGGVGIAGPPLLVIIFFATGLHRIDGRMDLLLLPGAVLYFVTGLLDDFVSLKPKSKILLQILATAISGPVIMLVLVLFVNFTLRSEPLMVVLASIPNLALLAVVWFIWVIGFVNAYNFMDGMNGKAGVFAVVVLMAFSGIVALAAPHEDDNVMNLFHKSALVQTEAFALITVTTLGALAGFLCFNCRTNAPIFLGDSGSHLVGYIIAALAYLTSDSLLGPGRSLLAFTIVLVPFIYDVALTLIKRARAGEKVWEAHRGHLYQRLMIVGYGHMRVLGICLITYIACGALGVACAVAPDHAAYRALALLLALFVMACYHVYVLRVEARTR